MNLYEESAYYNCWRADCPHAKECDGYGWIDQNPPEGCLVYSTQKEGEENEERDNH